MNQNITRLVAAASLCCALGIVMAHGPAAASGSPAQPATPVASPTPHHLPPTPTPTPPPTPTQPPTSTAPSYPCNNINAYVTRPTVSTSVCPVPPHHVVLETGYTNTTTTGVGANSTTNVPQAFIHAGIGPRIEFDFTPPSAESANNGLAKISGTSDLGFGLKTILGYTPKAEYGVGASMTLPTGSAAYTNGASTYAFVANGTYALASNVSLFGTAAYDWLVGTDSNGNLARFGSFVPSLGISYSLPSSFYVFGEAANFGKVAPTAGARSLLDYGIQKMIGQHMQLDAEAGNALNAVNGSRFHYVGAGASFLFGK